MKYPVITLKEKRERSLINRHPWLFSGAIEKADKTRDGAIVEIRSATNQLLAYGHYVADSQIVCRIFEFTDQSQTFSAPYWKNRFQAAVDYRKAALKLNETNAYRLFNAEGDRLPGLIADVYNDLVVLQLRTEGMMKLSPLLVDFLTRNLSFKHILLKNEREADKISSEWLEGEKKIVEFTENGLKFVADPVNGQKTGFFLDQRNNRLKLKELAQGRTVLNAFSYTGGFAVYALAGGAKSVTSVDISKNAGLLCAQNVAANFENAPHTVIAEDCFDYLRNMPEGEFDLIILDPPAFTKHISTVDKASRGYKDINLKAFNKIKSGGLMMTYSCSQHISPDLFRKIVFSAAADSGRNVKVISVLGHGADHPVDVYHPEGDYLKGLLLYVD